MILTRSPQALPGSCYLCGSASRECFVDLQVSIEFHGAVYLCNLCITEMAGLLGFASPEAVVQLISEIEQLRSELYRAQVRVAGLGKALDGLRDAGFDVGLVASTIPDERDDSTDQELHKIVGSEGSVAYAGEGSVASREGEASESVHDSNVAGLRSDDSGYGSSREFSLDL